MICYLAYLVDGSENHSCMKLFCVWSGLGRILIRLLVGCNVNLMNAPLNTFIINIKLNLKQCNLPTDKSTIGTEGSIPKPQTRNLLVNIGLKRKL